MKKKQPQASAELAGAGGPTPGVFTITLDLPPNTLSLNARCHWSKKPTKRFRTAARDHARAVKPPGLPWPKATMTVDWYFADKRGLAADDDNLVGRTKAVRDGIADAGVVSNDRDIRTEIGERAVDKANPRIVVRLTRLDGARCPDKGAA